MRVTHYQQQQLQMDDQQIGGGSGNSMGPSTAESADNSGPLEKRIVSKNWSVRASAYEELTKMSNDAQKASKADFFKEHIGNWKEYLKDSNPGALEKALTCLLAFIDKIHPSLIVDHQNTILGLLVEKCLGHAKPVIQNKATEVILLMFEVSENFEVSVETLQDLCKHKNIKVMTCGTSAVAVLLENFGIKKVKIADYSEQMLKNAQNTNPACKNAAYDFYKACYKWIGEAIMPQIEDKLKKIQIDDLKKLFEEVKAKGDKSKRVVRSEKAKAEAEALNAQIDAAIAEEAKVEEVDPLEFAPVKDVLANFGGEWQDATAEIKKWDEKVAKLNEIVEACKNAKIKPANTDGIAAFLKKEAGATNINISMAAINASTALANGMGKNFGPAIKILMTTIILKFKEKKPQIMEALNKFCDVVPKCANLDDLRDEVIPLISNVAPGVKTGIIKFIEQAVLVTYIDVLKNVSDDYLKALAVAMEDKDGGVRDTALHCMGIFKGRIADKAEKYVKDLNPQKMAKIEEAVKEVKPSKYDRPENYKPPAPKKAPAKKADDDDGMDLDMGPPKKAPPKGLGQKPKKKVEDEEMKNDDDLMDFDNGPPKKAPPKGIGVKPKKKTDEAMESEPSTPAKKPPALSSAKPKAATAASTKGPTAPVINDEDMGAGMSKEDAIAKAEEFFEASTIKKFEESKWQTRVEAFNEIQDQIKDREATHDIIEAAAKFIKVKMKDWKESNINLQKSIVGFFQFIAQNCEVVNKRTLYCAMSFFVDKIGDVKLSQAIKEMLMDISELVTPKFVCLQVIKYAATAKAPKNIQEGCAIITQIIEEFGISGIALKETIDFGKVAAAHATPAVRQAAMKMYCEVYKHVGDAMRSFLTEIKESTLKMIDAELGKVQQYKKGEFQKKRNFRGEAAEEEQAAGKGGKKGKAAEDDPLASLPREDISKKLNSKLMEQFKNKDWKIRKKAGDDVEALLREAKMRIEPNGLNELMDALKNGMKDPNKAVVKVYIALLGLMADALGPGIKQFTKKCLVPMLTNISDKQSLVRNDVTAAMNKWKDAVGAEVVINQLGPVLEIENPEARTESFKWIQDNKEAIPSSDCASLVKPLTLCLTDKSKAIRDQSEQIIEIVMPIVGYQAFASATNDMKPAIKQTLKPILEKLKSTCGDAGGGGGAPDIKQPEKTTEAPKEEKKAAANSFAKAAEQKQVVEKKGVKAAAAPPLSARGKPAEDEDQVVIKPQNKQKRQANDQKVKWPLFEVKGDHIEKLMQQCYDIFGQKFHDQMWAKAQDFNKHIKCVDILEGLISSQPDECLEVLDIIFKWSNVRLNESSNTKLVLRILDYFGVLLEFLIKNANPLEDFEAHVLLGTLCDKVGINNKILMDKMRKLIRMTYDVYDIKQVFRLIIDHGVKAKNLKSVAECLDELADFVTKNGIDSVTKKDFVLFITCADSPDKSVRENALKVFAECYIHLGEDLWRLLAKDVPAKVKGLLEQRFKQVQKKSGTGLIMSTNSAQNKVQGMKTNNLMVSQGPGAGAATSRHTMQVSGGAELKFSRALQQSINKADEQQIDNGQNQITQDMQKFAPFQEKETEDIEMKYEDSKQALQEVFQGKRQIPNDMPPMAEDKPMEDMNATPLSNKQPQNEMIQEKPKPKKEEEDEEIQEMLKRAQNNLDIDPALRQEQENILNQIQQLVVGDLLKRVDSLVALNEIISAAGGQSSENPNQNPQDMQNQQQALIRCCNELISAFTHVLNDIFSYPVNDIPLRFTKYFITIVNKTCACKEIMREVTEKKVFNLAQQLLTRLLIENLDKIGQNKEGELILKNLNSAMLRMLENCNQTYIFVVLFKLLKQYKDNADMPKLAGLIIKCLLKLSKVMDRLIDKLNLSKFLVAIHEYLTSINHDNKSQNDDLGIRIVKTLINEVVKVKKNDIWESYKVIEQHPQMDNHIKKWIQIILRSLPGQSHQPVSQELQADTGVGISQSNLSESKQPAQSRMYIEFEIKKIIAELKDPSKIEMAIPKLDKFSKANPTYNFTDNLRKESDQFCSQVMSYLESFRNGNSWKSTNEDSLGASGGDSLRISQTDKMAALKNKLNAVNQGRPSTGSQNLNSSMNKQSEFQSKMAALKQQKNSISGNMSMRGTVAGTTQNGNPNLNSSFSALNNSLSQKWAAINASQKKQGNFTGRQTTLAQSSLAQTITPGLGHNQLNSSSNKFQSKLGGGGAVGQQTPVGFANRLQNKMPPSGLQQPSGIPQPQQIQQQQMIHQQMNQQQLNQNAQNLNKSLNQNAGVSMNSFKSRLQGFQGGNPNQTNVPANSGGAGASSQDLKQRLAEMKAKLQGMNKK